MQNTLMMQTVCCRLWIWNKAEKYHQPFYFPILCRRVWGMRSKYLNLKTTFQGSIWDCLGDTLLDRIQPQFAFCCFKVFSWFVLFAADGHLSQIKVETYHLLNAERNHIWARFKELLITSKAKLAKSCQKKSQKCSCCRNKREVGGKACPSLDISLLQVFGNKFISICNSSLRYP